MDMTIHQVLIRATQERRKACLSTQAASAGGRILRRHSTHDQPRGKGNGQSEAHHLFHFDESIAAVVAQLPSQDVPCRILGTLKQIIGRPRSREEYILAMHDERGECG
jgi:hypothetical protein